MVGSHCFQPLCLHSLDLDSYQGSAHSDCTYEEEAIKNKGQITQ